MYTNNRARFCILHFKRENHPTSGPNFPPSCFGLVQEGPALPLGSARTQPDAQSRPPVGRSSFTSWNRWGALPICFSPLSPTEFRVRSNESKVKNIAELSVLLLETDLHNRYSFVFELLKLVLLLPVAIASVDCAFSAMNFVKNKLRIIAWVINT